MFVAAFTSVEYSNQIDEWRKKTAGKEHVFGIEYVNMPPSLDFLKHLLANQKDASIEENDFFNYEINSERETPWFHWLGTDANGKDIIAALMAGTRTALLCSILSIFIAVLIGLPIGILSGYYGKWIKSFSSTLSTTLTTLPKLLIVIMMIAIWGYNYHVFIMSFGVLTAPKIADIVRTKIQKLKKCSLSTPLKSWEFLI